MENAMSNVKKKVSKMRTLNENVPPMQIELDDMRGRYLQSKTMSPGFQSYAENIDFGSPPPLARYFYAGSPLSGKSSNSFNSPIFGASKYRSLKMQQYSGGGTSSGNSSFGSRGRLPLSPLSSIENFEKKSPPIYRTPVKGDEEVFVMDDIQVRPMSGVKSGRSSSSSSSGRGSSSGKGSSSSSTKSLFKTDICRAWEDSGNCRYNSKCQFAHGREELHPSRLSMKRKSEGQMGRQSARQGSWSFSPNSDPVHKPAEVAEAEHAVRRLPISQPTSPEPHCSPASSNTISDWSPLDDGIEVVLPNGSGRDPSREEVEAYILGTLNQRTTKWRLPVFDAICKVQ
ncbi:zinc finger C-x8-C-x5-C-x3-H type protein [Trifolium pratense]|uniref:Zinc finger C-x8-C-x5-C-x3-H type protein n=1 Tax=Trifolium pratense TaxID=57577 RepID=A0A2K3P973_TRIPR|nr:zinc finger C-x8-C-x5-C-x3-H type protein [Trifolium pratense]